MSPLSVLGFLLAIVPLSMTPGASFALATQHTRTGQPQAARWVIVGTGIGIFSHATLAALGLSAVVMNSPEAFSVVKIIGGYFLIGLGLFMITQVWRGVGPVQQGQPEHIPRSWTARSLLLQAFFANVLNPKAAAVYLTLAPQFLDAQHLSLGPMLILATVHVLFMALWLGSWASLLRAGERFVRSQKFMMIMSVAGGVVLIALGSATLFG